MTDRTYAARRHRSGGATAAGRATSAHDEVLALQATAGNRAVAHVLQAKLTVGAAHDQYEQEADQVADQVVSGASADVGQRLAQVQRTLAEGITPLAQRQEVPEEEEVQTVRLQRNASPDGPFAAPEAAEERISARAGSGSPLPEGAKDEMEGKFGVDFSSVRLQQDGEAGQIASDLQAKHFTAGSDIYVGKGGLDPTSDQGKHDLAHELTHVVQQAGGAQRMPRRREDEAG